MIQASQGHGRPVQNIVDLSQDLNQQTNVISGHPQTQEPHGAVAVGVEGGEGQGQRWVYGGERNGENSQEAPADVLPLENDEGPAEETFPSQTQHNRGDTDIHVWCPRWTAENQNSVNQNVTLHIARYR